MIYVDALVSCLGLNAVYNIPHCPQVDSHLNPVWHKIIQVSRGTKRSVNRCGTLAETMASIISPFSRTFCGKDNPYALVYALK